MSKSISASSLTPGSSYIARWGAWQINIDSIGASWHVRIWSYVRGVVRVQIAKRAVFATSADAVAWVCEVLRRHHAVVFIDGQHRSLAEFLAFAPAPRAVSCG